ncbi:MAG TPA: NAD(P)/FAD-dependent oxidoreductase, partial [Pirellulales bacterium]
EPAASPRGRRKILRFSLGEAASILSNEAPAATRIAADRPFAEPVALQSDARDVRMDRADVCVVGAGHNGLITAVFLARAGLRVVVCDEREEVGGACKTERPFPRAPQLATSTGAYLLGLMPPELIDELGVEIPTIRRDPHYFLPTLDRRFLLFGSDQAALQRQLGEFFSPADAVAVQKLDRELAELREDLAAAWLAEPLPLEETAERCVRPGNRAAFIDLCRRPISDYLARFEFRSDLLAGMYAVTDGFTGVHGGWDTPGVGMNFLLHNIGRLPGSDGTWMIVRGGMGVVTQRLAEAARRAGANIETNRRVASIDVRHGQIEGVTLADGRRLAAPVVVVNADPFRMRSLVGREKLPSEFNNWLDSRLRDGTSLKVNLCLDGLPTFRCLPENQGQFGATIHLLPQNDPIGALRQAYAEACAGRLPERPPIEWYVHTTVDPTLQDSAGRHNAAFFVQWVPYRLAESDWATEESRYVQRLLAIADEFAPGVSKLVRDAFVLSPPKIESHFGITRGHIQHIDNTFGFTERLPYRLPLGGLYACGAGCHPGGSVIGAAGRNAARVVLGDLAK